MLIPGPGASTPLVRLEKLERQNRRLRRIAGLALVLALAACVGLVLVSEAYWVGLLNPRLAGLSAHELRLRATPGGDAPVRVLDPQERLRALVYQEPDGRLAVKVFDDNDHSRMTVGAGGDELSVTFTDDEGVPRSRWTVGRDGPRFEQLDKDGKPIPGSAQEKK